MVALVIGAAVLLASTNIDPKSGVRAQFTALPSATATPPDLFANITYIPFTSSDGAVQFERPAAWTEIPVQQPFTYIFAPINPDGSSSDISRFDVILMPIGAIGLTGVTANSTPEDVLGAIVSTNDKAQASDLVPEKIDGMDGGSIRLTQTVSNQDVNEERVAEFIVLKLEDGYIVLVEAVTTSANGSRMNNVMQHLRETFKLNRDVALAALKAAYPATSAPTPTLAASVTPAATTVPAATAAVTAEATATAQATATPTQ